MSTRVGIFNQMWAEVGVTDRAAITTALDDIRHAEAHGFASVWIGEHHLPPGLPGTFHGRVPAAEVFLGYVLGATTRIAVGTGVKILSTNSARRSVEEMAMLHLLAPGRVEFGLGQGPTLPGASETRAEKAARYRALLAEILGTLKGDIGFSLSPCPALVEKIWVAARDEPTLTFAAAHDLNLVIGQAEIGVRQAAFVRAYRAAGGHGQVRGVRVAFVAESRAEAAAECATATAIYFAALGHKGYHAQAVADGLLPPTAPTPAEQRRQLDVFAGTPEDVAAALNAHIAETGIDRLDIMPQLPGMTTAAVRRSMTLFEAEVRPRLRFPALAET
ncbi:LLM class flavin-dependent oxidoreductase [Acidisoma cladoniae]|uniref:LLM class flavin-dependent oxidoreductase n=1 Tax=Acidisoma cladoniae TaxID=3040935 RepID=UPI002549CD48|nr:LLM class flavin-dependent oxidoreductase [Acidisoma sp. PAMC 29798]